MKQSNVSSIRKFELGSRTSNEYINKINGLVNNFHPQFDSIKLSTYSTSYQLY